MRTAGKIAVLAMSLALAGVLAACGGSGSSSAASGSASGSSASASSASASASSASASASSAAASSASASASAASSAASASAGAVAEYTNEYFGIKFENPGDWQIKGAADLADQNQSTGAEAAGAEIEMIASSPDNLTTITVAVEQPNDANKGQDAEAHLNAEIDVTLKNLDAAENTSYEMDDATLSFTDGSTMPAKAFSITKDGATIHVVQACAVKDGVFLDILGQGSPGSDMDTLLAAFQNFKLVE